MSRGKFNSVRRFEQLEDRRMMVGDISFSNGIITIDGGGYDDVAEVRFENGRVYADLWAEESDGDIDHEDFDISISNFYQIVFNGYAGNDTLTIYGTENVIRESHALKFYGGADNDTLFNNADGMGGIWAWAEGGEGDDTLYGGFRGGQSMLDGGPGNDTLYGGPGGQILRGGTGNDTLAGGPGDDRYLFWGGNLGTDTIVEAPNSDSDFLDFSVPQGLNINLTRTGTNYAVNSPDLILILPNDTAIEGVAGTMYNDTIVGNSRDNFLFGGNGDDTIVGGAGNDTMYGNDGSDRFVFWGTNLGSDVIVEGNAMDNDSLDFYMFGGPVNLNLALTTQQVVHPTHLTLQLAYYESGIESVTGSFYYGNTIHGNSRDNTISGGLVTDYLYGGLGADRLFGNRGNDWLYGEGGDDELHGQDGNDRLYGGNGLDTLYGGNHDDYLDGGYDSYEDQLWGGYGRDTFVAHLRRSGSQLPLDRARDYNDREDLIALIWH